MGNSNYYIETQSHGCFTCQILLQLLFDLFLQERLGVFLYSHPAHLGGLQSVSFLVGHQTRRGGVVSLIRTILGVSSIGDVMIAGYPHGDALIPLLALLKVS